MSDKFDMDTAVMSDKYNEQAAALPWDEHIDETLRLGRSISARALKAIAARLRSDEEKLAEAQAEINVWRESADGMKAAWNAACAEIAALRTKLAEARELLGAANPSSVDWVLKYNDWLAANREGK